MMQTLFAKLWWGPLRRAFEPLARRLAARSGRVWSGPLRGVRFRGSTSQMLGIYEPQVQRLLAAKLAEGEVFYDVGAYNGYISLLAARRVGEAGAVYAFEPLPANHARVQRAFEENEIANAMLVAEALSDEAGAATLFFDDGTLDSMASLVAGAGSATVEVALTTLDVFATTHRRPDFIKVDVEGAEVQVIAGAAGLMASEAAPRWLVEVHSAETEGEAQALFDDFGYATQTLDAPRAHRVYPRHLFAQKAAPETHA